MLMRGQKVYVFTSLSALSSPLGRREKSGNTSGGHTAISVYVTGLFQNLMKAYVEVIIVGGKKGKAVSF